MYNGAVKQAARQQFVPMPELPKVQGMGEVLDRAIDDGLEVADKYSKLHDFGEAQKVEHLRRMNDVEMRKGLEKGLTAKWGTKESFFNTDGTRNEDNIAAFKHKWQEAQMGVQKSFWRRDSAMRDDEAVLRINDGLDETVELSTLQAELGNMKRAFEANYALAVESGDADGAKGSLKGAVQAGILTEAEAKLRALRLDRKGERERLSGMRAEGLTGRKAALAELMFGKDGAAGESAEVLPSFDVSNDLTMDAERLKGLDEDSDTLTLNKPMLRDLLTPEQREGEMLTSKAMAMGVGLAGDVQQWEVSDLAPEWAQQAVQASNRAGGWTRERYGSAIGAIGTAIVMDPAYAGLDDKAMAELIYKAVKVPDMGEQLFDSELDAEAAHESMLQERVANIMTLRDSNILKRVKAAFATGDDEADGYELPSDNMAAWYVTERACDALGTARRNAGAEGLTWYEENEVIGEAIESAQRDWEAKGGKELADAYRKERAAADKALVDVYYKKAREWQVDVKAGQAEAKAKEKAKKDAEAEAKKKPKAQTKEEKLKERPYLGEVEVRVRFEKNNLQRATLTVPAEEYEAMREQLECGDKHILRCKLGGKELLVLPGKGWTVNLEAATLLMPSNKKDWDGYGARLRGKEGMSLPLELERVYAAN